MTTTERVAAHRQRQDAEGKMQVNITLPRATVKKLDRLCKSTGQSRAVVLDQLIKGASK